MDNRAATNLFIISFIVMIIGFFLGTLGISLTIPIITLIIVIGLYSFRLCKEEVFNKQNKKFIDFSPNLLSIIGVLGTFIGIFIGLQKFNSADITASVPKLLDGLKTAFITSIFGMGGSIILNLAIKWRRTINAELSDSEIENDEEEDPSTAKICKAIKSIEEKITLQNEIQFPTLQTINTSLKSIAKSSELTTNCLNSLLNNSETLKNSINTGFNNTNEIITKNEEDLSNTILNQTSEVTAHMDKTNQLLTEKFNEFSELLRRSNTEALVEVMKNVTEEFQAQMNSLINKLIQENFQELNNSVKQLNQWQQENKVMVNQLTEKYQSMNEVFGNTSEIFARVCKYSSELTGEAGLLSKLIRELQRVMIDDTNFKKTADILVNATRNTNESIEIFNHVTYTLNQWMKKQKSFSDTVVLLMHKLEEVNKVKDYGEEFWSGTRQGLEKNINVIESGSQKLQAQVDLINQEFYNRLNTTISSLDNCITAIAKDERR